MSITQRLNICRDRDRRAAEKSGFHCAGNSDLIHQMYIYGSSLRSYLLAAVVPSKGMLTLILSPSAMHRS